MTNLTPDSLTGRVLLRDVAQEDLPIFFQHQLDPEAIKMAAFRSRGWDAFVTHWTKILGDDSVIKKTILVDGHVAGNIVIFGQPGERAVGYWLGKEYWGKGIASAALAQLLRQASARPLYAHVAKGNMASLRVLQKCGFTISGEDKSPSNTPGEVVEEFILTLQHQSLTPCTS
jgi:RimJ/RimL family protein N-acetyltransferase